MTVKFTVGFLVILITLFWLGLYLYWSSHYKTLVYPRTMIGTINLGGTTKDQAENILKTRVDRISFEGLNFFYNDDIYTVPVMPLSPDSAAPYPLLVFEIDQMVDVAYGSPEDRTFFKYLLNHFLSKKVTHIKPIYTIQEKQLSDRLLSEYSDLVVKPENSFFSVKDNSSKGIELTINPEKNGLSIEPDRLLGVVYNNLDNLENPTINVLLEIVEPEIKTDDLNGREAEALKLINSAPLTLKIDEVAAAEIDGKKTWPVSAAKLATWIKIEKSSASKELILDQDKISAFLTDVVAKDINRDAVLPRFEIKDGKVTSWQTGKSGYSLNIPASTEVVANLFNEDDYVVELITEKILPTSLTEDSDFQIKEIIGTGHSKFSGSPKNRRHNIGVGAASLHGLLIKPGEEFSLLAALGEIDGTTGYLTELVIKGDKTVPEYGGGLCQVGTTVFRGAIDSGLPITERRNHSYRVSYYEPAGTDATIYDPAPDFRFLNDTGNYILIQSRVSGDDLYFDFWGVSDGRIAEATEPVIYNIVKPPPTKIVETDSLAPGEKKCTESAHSGADAYFDYTVIYPEGSTTTPVQTRRFSSHYVPWQAVCLVGKEATTTPPVLDETSTSTTEVAPIINLLLSE